MPEDARLGQEPGKSAPSIITICEKNVMCCFLPKGFRSSKNWWQIDGTCWKSTSVPPRNSLLSTFLVCFFWEIDVNFLDTGRTLLHNYVGVDQTPCSTDHPMLELLQVAFGNQTWQGEIPPRGVDDKILEQNGWFQPRLIAGNYFSFPGRTHRTHPNLREYIQSGEVLASFGS